LTSNLTKLFFSVVVIFLISVPQANGLALVLSILVFVASMTRYKVAERIAVFVLISLCFALLTSTLANLLGIRIHTLHAVFALLNLAITILRRKPQHQLGDSGLKVSLGAFLGGALLIVSALSAFISNSDTWFAFAMSGDSANNILFQMEHQIVNGIRPGVNTNAVPMSASLLQLSSISDVVNATFKDLIVGYSIIWLVLTIFGSILVGVYFSSCFEENKPLAQFLASSIGSLLPLIWYFSGYSFDYGFLNTQILLVIFTAVLVLYKSQNISKLDKLTFLVLTSTLILATWSPLVLLTLGLGAFLIGKEALRQTLAEPAFRKIAFVSALLSLAGYSIFYVLPNLLQNGSSLAQPGAVFPIGLEVHIFLAVTLIVSSIVARQIGDSGSAASSLTLVMTGTIGSIILARGYDWNFSGYYSAKFLWLISLIGIIEVCRLGISIISKNTLRFSNWILTGGTSWLLVLSIAPVSPIQGYESAGAIGQLNGNSRAVINSNSISRIQAPSESKWTNFYWKTNDPDEAFINFWNLQLTSSPIYNFFSRRLIAYGLYEKNTREDLCDAISEIGLNDLRVITNDVVLLLEGDFNCNSRKYKVIGYG
jgi:hypothetical protein